MSEEPLSVLMQKEIAFQRGNTGRFYKTFLYLSKEILKEKLFAYLPLMITGVILVFVALFVAAFINAEKGSRYYCIYYLVGGTKRSCFLIACGNVLGTVAVSALFLTLCLYFAMKKNSPLTLLRKHR